MFYASKLPQILDQTYILIRCITSTVKCRRGWSKIQSRGYPISTVICCRAFTAEAEGALCSSHIHQPWLGCQEHIELCVTDSKDICAEWTARCCRADEWTQFIRPSLWVSAPSLFQVVYFIKTSQSYHIESVNLWHFYCQRTHSQCKKTDMESTAWRYKSEAGCGSFSKNVYAHDSWLCWWRDYV